MLRHQETNVLKAGGYSSQGKDRIDGGNFFKILFLETNLIRPTIFKHRHCGLLFQVFYKKNSTLQRNTGTHKIRKNRYGTVSGRPDALYYLPESFSGTSDLLKYVADRDY